MNAYELQDEEFLGSFRYPVGNGLLIVRDGESTDVHESWTGDTEIDIRPDSIYLCVQNPVDGPVAVEVFEGPPATPTPDEAIQFDGTIASVYGTFIVHDPMSEVRMVIRTDHPGEVRLRIAASESWHPAAVRINFWY